MGNNNIQFCRSLLVSTCAISQIIYDLPNGMAAGNVNLTAENLKYVGLNLFIILGVIVHIIKKISKVWM